MFLGAAAVGAGPVKSGRNGLACHGERFAAPTKDSGPDR